jgi:DNA-binding beta-propeller fold protein YncE
LYVTIGDPAVIQVFDAMTLREVQTVQTEPGTHTIAFNLDIGKVYAFTPETHRASVDEEV